MGLGEQATKQEFQCPVCGGNGVVISTTMHESFQRWACPRQHEGLVMPDASGRPVLMLKGEETPPEAPWPSVNMAGRSMLNEAEIAHLLCEACGVPSGPTEEGYREQAMVFVEAFRIFVQRTDRHGSSWKQSGWRGALFDSRKKMDRLWQEFMINEEPPPDLDSALDLLNFVAFFVRGRANNIEGTWGWRN